MASENQQTMSTITFTFCDYLYVVSMTGIILIIGAMFAVQFFQTHKPREWSEDERIPLSEIKRHPNNRRTLASEEETELLVKSLREGGWRRPTLTNNRPCPWCNDIVPAHYGWCPMNEPTAK
jgi:hypothetical protein